jgi:hypothetical protein
LVCSESRELVLSSWSLASVLSFSASMSPRRCCREVISCSLVRRSCSRCLTLASASSARAIAESASMRSELSF